MRNKGVFRCLWLLSLQFIFIASLTSQNISRSHLDSLSYEQLLSEFNEYDGDSISQETIARTYLNRARKEGDTIKMARGYDRLARIFHSKKNIQFADSVIALTKNLNHMTYPALGYMIKGYEYDALNDVIMSIDNYINAYNLSVENGNIPQQVFIMHLLIFNKAIWGNKIDALKMQHERHMLINQSDYSNYIIESTRKGADIDENQLLINEKILSYESYVLCYKQLNKIDSAKYFLKKGILELENYKWVGKKSHQAFFDEAMIELEYANGDYSKALKLSSEYLKKYKNELMPNELLSIIYVIGMSKLRSGKKNEGINDFKRADSIYETSKIIIRPHYRDIFEELRQHYKKEFNTSEEIRVLDKLIQIDSVSKRYYQYFEPNMIRNFETPRLLEEKEQLISKLRSKNKKSKIINWGAILLLLISLLSLGYYAERQHLYKKRFNNLISEQKSSNSEQYAYELSGDIIDRILSKLERFETQKEFLISEISLLSLAKDFNTNANYLSRVINLKIGKNFSQYINDLRIEYAMECILTDKKMRKYTIKAIAEESGYKNAESFSKAFYKRNGIYPSYYIRKLNKADQTS